MLLGDADLFQAIEDEHLKIDPFDSAQVQPASYDIRLGKTFQVMKPHKATAIYPHDNQVNLWDYAVLTRPVEGFVLHPGAFALATTKERVELSPSLAAQVGGKSSLGRLGLIVHATAGFIDPGFRGQITLELSNVSPVPIVLYQDMLIGQLVFSWLKTPAQFPYSGKYQNQEGVTTSRYHLNYDDEGPKLP